MSKLLIPVLFVVAVFLAGCHGEDDSPEIYPIRFGQTDYTIRVGTAARISFVDGSGVYELTADNPDVLGKFYIDIETSTLTVVPAAVGESTLTVTDVVTNTSTTLKFTVEDFYLSFMVAEIEGENANPYLNVGNEIRFIRDKENSRPLKIMWQDHLTYELKCVADGYFDIGRSAENVFTMSMMLHGRHDEEFEGFNYTLGGDGEYLDFFNRYFGYGWDKNINSRALPVKKIIMIMTDPLNGCKITCSLLPF